MRSSLLSSMLLLGFAVAQGYDANSTAHQETPYAGRHTTTTSDSVSAGSTSKAEPPKKLTAKQRKRERQKLERRGKKYIQEAAAPRMLAGADSCSGEVEDPAYDTDKYGECVNNTPFYPIHWGDSANEEIGCMHILQSNQDENDFKEDVEDWILIGGSTNDANIHGGVPLSSAPKIYIHMLDYIGGIKWAYHQKDTADANQPEAIADCALANFGLQLAFVTKAPIHLLIFETLTGNILYQYRINTYANSIIHNGIEARNKEPTGIFLGYGYHDGANLHWAVLELDQSTGEREWVISA